MSGSARWQARLAAAVARPLAPLPGQFGPRVSSARLAIYRNNALAPLVQSLEDSLPACRHLHGADPWRALLLEFVRAHPPCTAVLRDYGDGLPDWLAARGEHPALCQLAALELAIVRCWHAADQPVLAQRGFSELQARPERLAGLRLGLHPAAVLVHSEWPLGSLWLAARQAGTAPAPQPERVLRAGPAHVDTATPLAPVAEPGAETVLVVRGEWQVEVRLLDAPAAALLQALAGGDTLAEAVTAGLAAGGEAPGLLAALVGSAAFLAPEGISAG